MMGNPGKWGTPHTLANPERGIYMRGKRAGKGERSDCTLIHSEKELSLT